MDAKKMEAKSMDIKAATGPVKNGTEPAKKV